MEENASTESTFNNTDIFFECPRCGKSLAIDEKGAGMYISCPDCGLRVQVPQAEAASESDDDAHHVDFEDAGQDKQPTIATSEYNSIRGDVLKEIFREITSIQNSLDKILDKLQNEVT